MRLYNRTRLNTWPPIRYNAGRMYKSLQAGRAIAAVLVVLFHLGVAVSASKYFGIPAFGIPFSFGDSGVEFFFVLSGFIIFTAHRADISKPRKLAAYVYKRFIRVYPTYWIIFGVIFLMALALREDAPRDLGIILKSLALLPQDPGVVGGTGAPVIIVAWTLQYEIVFYLFFALLIVNQWMALAAALAFALNFGLCSLGASCAFPRDFLASWRMLVFGMGMIVAFAHASPKIKIARPGLLLVMGLAAYAIISADKVLQIGVLSAWKTPLYGVACSMIVLGLTRLEDAGRALGRHPILQLLGDSSYALYLIHYPLISVMSKGATLLGLTRSGPLAALAAYLVMLVACLLAAIAFHTLIEKPLLAALRKRAPRAAQTAPSKINSAPGLGSS